MGRDIKATHGLAQSLIALLGQPEVTHVAVAFDTVIRSFRNDYDCLTGTRRAMVSSRRYWRNFLWRNRLPPPLGLTIWPMVEFEADDAIAAAAVRFAASSSVEQVVMCSPDKDLAQVVSGDRVVMLDRRKREVIDEDGVVAKFGVSPPSIPDYLALVGDSADGIPGIRGWGAKTTAAVLTRYENIDQIPTDVADWDLSVRGAANLVKVVTEQWDNAQLYRQLATLRLDVPLPETEPEQLRWMGVRQPGFADLCQSLGLESLLSRLP